MSDIADLGFRVNSQPVKEAANDLNALAPAADKAERATDRFNRGIGQIVGAVNKATSVLERIETSIGRLATTEMRAEKATENLSQSFGVASASMRAFDSVTASVTMQMGTLVTSASRVDTAMEQEAASINTATAAVQKHSQALMIANDNLKATSFNAGGIAAQFQDVGVTAAMGMNPLVIGLQQGTQLSGQLMMMQGNLWTNLKAGLLAVISPLSLLTIGFITLLAVGIQFVKWGKLAESVLNTIADVLVPIAPYAVAAAAGLALFYAPAIIAGIGTVIVSLARLAAQAVVTGAALIAANPVGALVLGFAAVATAAVIFRDDLAKILGRDIVQDAQNGVNWIIGAFVGGFNSIRDTWGLLPAAMADLTVQAAQGVLDGIVSMINDTRTQIIEFLTWAQMTLSAIPGFGTTAGALAGVMAGSGAFTAPQLPNPNAGAAAYVGNATGNAMSSAMGVDYVGQTVELIQRGASGAADALRGLATAAGAAGTETDKAAKAAEKAAEAYRKVTDGAREFIAEQRLEAQALGMSSVQANTLRYAQQLLNQATAEGRTLTAAQRVELLGLAGQMAQTEFQTQQLTDAYNFGKSTLGSFFGDLKSGLMDGTSLWGSFAQAGLNALSSIADKALEMAANGIWDMIFSGIMGGIGGGSLGNTIGGGITGAFKGGSLQFASGGYTGNMSPSQPAGVVHGQEYVLNANATRRIGIDTLNAMNDNRPVSSETSGGNIVHYAPVYQISGVGLSKDDLEQVMRDHDEQFINDLPNQLQAIQADPRRRKHG